MRQEPSQPHVFENLSPGDVFKFCSGTDDLMMKLDQENCPNYGRACALKSGRFVHVSPTGTVFPVNAVFRVIG